MTRLMTDAAVPGSIYRHSVDRSHPEPRGVALWRLCQTSCWPCRMIVLAGTVMSRLACITPRESRSVPSHCPCASQGVVLAL
jgi:hypothetical protein